MENRHGMMNGPAALGDRLTAGTWPRVAALLAALTLAGTARQAGAISYWNGATANWNTAGNWSNGLPGANNAAFIGNGGTCTYNAGTLTVSGLKVGVDSGDQDCPTGLNGDGVLNFATGNLTVNGIVTINRSGNAGRLNLSGGTLKCNNIATQGNSGGSRITMSGGTLNLNGGTIAAFLDAFNFDGGTLTDCASINCNFDVSTGTPTLNAATKACTCNAAVTAGNLYKSGAQSLTLGGTTDNASLILYVNANAGNVILNKTSSATVHAVAGIGKVDTGSTVTLSGSGGDQIYNGAVGTVTISGGTLNLNGQSETVKTVALSANGSAISGAGTLTLSNAGTAGLRYTGTSGSGTVSCDVVLGSGTGWNGLDNGANNGGTLVINGVISGDQTFELYYNGAAPTGVVELRGANSYTNTTVLNDNILRLANGDNRIKAGNDIVVTLKASLDLNGQAQTFDSVTGDGAILTGGGALTIGSGDSSSAFTGIISGAGSLTKTGAGTLTLGGANTYSGATAVNAGTLVLPTTQTGGGAIAVADGATLGVTVASAGTSLACASLTLGTGGATTNTFNLGAGRPSAPVIQTPSLTVNGPVSVNVTGVGLSTGAVQLIAFTAPVAGSGGFVLNRLPAGVEGYVWTNAVNSSIELVITHVQRPVWAGYIDAATNTVVTLAGLNTVTNLALAGVRADSIVVTDANVPPTTTFVRGVDYDVVTAGDVTGIKAIGGALAVFPKDVAVACTGFGGMDGRWQADAPSNWVDAAANRMLSHIDGLFVRFDDSATRGTTQVTLGGNVAPFDVVVSNTALTYAIGGDYAIGGLGKLIKDSAGVLWLTNASPNTYAGDTEILKGMLKLGAGGLPDGVGKGNVRLDGTLELLTAGETINGLSGAGLATAGGAAGSTLTVGNSNGSSTFSGVLANGADGGLLALTKTGTGKLTLAGDAANTYSGLTTVNGGTLELAKAAGYACAGPVTIGDGTASDVLRIGAASQQLDPATVLSFKSGASGNSAFLHLNGFDQTIGGMVNVNAGQAAVLDNEGVSNCILTVANVTDQTWDGYIRNYNYPATAGALGLTKDGPGLLTLASAAGRVNYAGPTWVKAGTLKLVNQMSFASDIVIDSVLNLENASTTNWAFNRVLSGAGSLVKTGAGVVTLGGDSSYGGGTAIRAGRLTVTHNNALGAAGTVAVANVAGAQLFLGANGLTVNRPLIIEGGSVTGQGALHYDQTSGSATYSGPITITGATAAGGHFASANGGMLILAGPIIAIAPVVAIRTGRVMLSHGGSSYSTLLIGAGTTLSGLDNAIPVGALVSVGVSGAATLDLNNFNQELAGLTKGVNAATVNNSGADVRTLTLNIAGGITNLYAGVVAGKIDLAKTGTGTLTLTGVDTYSGLTTVGTGTLLVNGSHTGGGAYTVSGGTLGGAGTTASALTVEAGGTVAPGASAGRLTVGSTILRGTLALEIGGALPGAEHDQLAVNGTVSLGGARLQVKLLNGFVPPDDVPLVVLANDGTDPIEGAFRGMPEGSATPVDDLLLRITYRGGDGNDIALQVDRSPPGTVLILR